MRVLQRLPRRPDRQGVQVLAEVPLHVDVQAPTLDNGSDWYTARTGEVSASGLLVFSVGPDGWDDLRLL
ncbi:hypothetical protein [Streptomyces bobili]|uniref:Uncharacterized protein n=1 Tax=Streptomyces bobili TaxID=67280 RepID=A0ABZ1R492_9ACTN|nr:hypothetical protein [Streptomyces bobili]